MTEDELFECPCCGGKAELIGWGGDYKVECIRCGLKIDGGPENELTCIWNSRVFPAWLREKIVELKKGYYCSDALDMVLSLTPGDNNE